MNSNGHRVNGTKPVRRGRRIRSFGFTSVLVVSLCSPAAPLLAHNPWPLVNEAEGAVWGSLIEIREGVQERRLLIAAARGLKGVTDAPATLELLWPSAKLPDSGSINLGDTGIFLFKFGGGPGNPAVGADGIWLTGGFVALENCNPVHGDLTRLISIPSDKEVEDWAPAVRLLESGQPGCRRLGLGWLLGRSMQLPDTLRPSIGLAFRREDDAVNQGFFLELFLLTGWNAAGDAAAGFLLTRDDPWLVELSVLYLGRHPSPSAYGTLLEAYRRVPADRRARLLEAYGRLRVRAAFPLIEEALLSGREPEFQAALYALARCDDPAAVDLHLDLLSSDRMEIRRLAVVGLATLSTPRALRALRELSESRDPSPIPELARELLKHPFRHAGVHEPTLRIQNKSREQ